MPKFKLSGVKAQEQKTGFEPYDGPEPTRNGFYRALIKVCKWGDNTSGSQGFSLTLELEAAAGDPKGHAVFDGFPMFSRSIITSGKDGEALKEGAQRNLSNFLAAIGAGDDPDVILEEGDEDKVNVKKIGKVNPIGRVVNIDLQMRLFEGDRRPEVGGIYPYKEIDAPTGKGRAAVLDEEDDESDLMESDGADEAEETDEGDEEYDARAEELDGLGIPALKKIAKELGLAVSGTKAALVERILDAEFAEDEDEDAEDEDETDETEEVDEDEAEDDEEEDDEEGDEDDEARAEREAELAEITDRIALKRILKEVNADFTVLKRHSEDDLRAAILSAEFGDGDLPF